jgi:hypothetical protein
MMLGFLIGFMVFILLISVDIYVWWKKIGR